VEIRAKDVVLCEFYFSDMQSSKKRPVLVLKDNLPYNDFIAIPISSQIQKLNLDEQIIDNSHFANGAIPKPSKLMLRKTFVVSKNAVIKRYGTISTDSFKRYKTSFCRYFEC